MLLLEKENACEGNHGFLASKNPSSERFGRLGGDKNQRFFNYAFFSLNLNTFLYVHMKRGERKMCDDQYELTTEVSATKQMITF